MAQKTKPRCPAHPIQPSPPVSPPPPTPVGQIYKASTSPCCSHSKTQNGARRMGEANRQGSAVPLLCTVGALLALLVPVEPTRAPDCGGILTPLGLSYLAEISKPHAEVALRRDLMAQRASDLFLGSMDPSRSRISSVKVVDLKLSLIPEAGLRMGIKAELRIAPLHAVPMPVRVSIQADLHVDMGPDGNLQLLTSACRPTVQAPSTREAESKSFRSLLDKEVNVDKLCLDVSKLLLLPNEQLMSLTAPFPVTPSCQLQYLPLAAPVFSKQGIALSLQTIFQVAGAAVPVPVSPVPFNMPELGSTSTSHLILAMSKHFYTSLYFTLERAGAFNMTIPSMLTTATLAQKITQVGSLYHEDLPIMLSAALRSSPRVVLEEGRAALKLFLTVHIGAGSPDFQSFLSVNADVTTGLQLSVSDTRMMISTAVIEDAELSLAASNVGLVPAALLEELFLAPVCQQVPAWMDDVLREGVHLPHLSRFTYTNVSVVIHKDYVLVPCNLKLHSTMA
ncbi:protein TENP-like isoform X2 [Coturnix japonica]|uniref:protein TENP-like isoform X2 n=1 Tax=Coturnix japonica TaxID=93934 RepID=UPI0013A5C7A6|nr:protein TENP-like isoform X2 [Coturnix japonica]